MGSFTMNVKVAVGPFELMLRVYVVLECFDHLLGSVMSLFLSGICIEKM